MFNRVDLKQETKKKLANKRWLQVFGVEFLAGLLSVGIALGLGIIMAVGIMIPGIAIIVALLFIVACVVLFPPITYGIFRYRQNVWRGTDNGFNDVLSGFQNMGLAVRTYFWKALWIGLWSGGFGFVMGFLSAFAGVGMDSYNYSYNYGLPSIGATGLAGGMLLLFWVIYIVWYVVLINRELAYSQLEYIVVEHPEIGAKNGLNLSKKMMKGHKGELFVVQLSFLPWIWLVILPVYICAIIGAIGIATGGVAFGVLIIIIGAIGSLLISMYVMPYMNITIAGYYDRLKEMNFERNTLQPEDFNETQLVVVEVKEEEIQFTPPDLK